MSFDIFGGKKIIFNLCFIKKLKKNWVIFAIFNTFLHNFIKKTKINLNIGSKVVIENFIGLKVEGKI